MSVVAKMSSGTVSTRITEKMAEAIITLVDQGLYLNLADFLRCAIRTELKREQAGSE